MDTVIGSHARGGMGMIKVPAHRRVSGPVVLRVGFGQGRSSAMVLFWDTVDAPQALGRKMHA